MIGIFGISIIEAHAGVKAITDCMVTEIASTYDRAHQQTHESRP
jgi:hypothetical protein